MVVGKALMRWSAWDRKSAPPRRYLVRLRAVRLEGISLAFAGDLRAVVALGIGWKGPVRARRIPYLHPGRKGSRSGWVSGYAGVRIGGHAVWLGGEENELEKVCCFSAPNVDVSGGGSSPVPFSTWEISFSVLSGNGGQGNAGKKKLKELGSTVVNIGKWAWDFCVKAKGRAPEVKESHIHGERKQFPITLIKDGSTVQATIHVDVSFIEIDIPVHGDGIINGRRHEEDVDDTGLLLSDGPHCSSDLDKDLPELLSVSKNGGRPLPSKHRRNSTSSSSSNCGDSSPEIHLPSSSKHRLLPWRSKSPTKHLSEPTEEDDDPVGRWEVKEFISRDRQTKLKIQTFFASIDQRHETAAGESACTALVAVIAEALHFADAKTPTRSEFDALIRHGSSQWRKLCADEACVDRFPNKHFDLDTVLEAQISSLSVLPQKSFVGFFEPESFESLRGALSFDDLWSVITDRAGGAPEVYIVSWNDHFFLLKLEEEACFVIDTLGERLFEGCRKAYMLKFDNSARLTKVPEVEDEEGCEVSWSGKDCCREFIKRFFAGIPVREELELEEKGHGSAALHQRLQIEFHYTIASCSASIEDATIQYVGNEPVMQLD